MEYKNFRFVMVVEKYCYVGIFGYCKLYEVIREIKMLIFVRGNKKLILE